MIKKFVFIIILALLTVLSSGKIEAKTVYEPRSVRVVKFSPEAGEQKNFYTLWGENVEIENEVNGDVYVAGGEVVVNGVINGDVLAAATNIIVNGEIRGNLRGVAESVFIEGIIGNNVTVAGGSVTTAKDSSIEGGLIALSAQSMILGPVSGQMKLFGENITLDSTIGSDAEVWAQNLKIEPEARLNGLHYYSDNAANIDPGASISGKLIKSQSEFFSQGVNMEMLKNSFEKYAGRGRLVFHLFAFLWAYLWGWLFLRFFPKTMDIFTQGLDKNIVGSALLGLALLFLIPLSVIILMITLVGIPLGFTLAFISLIFTYFAKITFSFWLGRRIVKEDKRMHLALGAGLLIYYLLTFIRPFGWIIAFFVLLAGGGSQFKGIINQYKELNSKHVI